MWSLCAAAGSGCVRPLLGPARGSARLTLAAGAASKVRCTLASDLGGEVLGGPTILYACVHVCCRLPSSAHPGSARTQPDPTASRCDPVLAFLGP